MNCNMLLKLSGQGAVYIRSMEKLGAGCDSHDHSDDEEFIVKQEPEVLEIRSSESDIEGKGNCKSGISW